MVGNRCKKVAAVATWLEIDATCLEIDATWLEIDAHDLEIDAHGLEFKVKELELGCAELEWRLEETTKTLRTLRDTKIRYYMKLKRKIVWRRNASRLQQQADDRNVRDV